MEAGEGSDGFVVRVIRRHTSKRIFYALQIFGTLPEETDPIQFGWGGWGLVHCIVLDIKYILQFNFITHSYVQTYFIDVSVSV